MGGKVTDKLDIYTFGSILITTEDLDPVYVILNKWGADNKPFARWLLAYWCFYHCGVASLLTDSKNYRKAMLEAADSKLPRGTERRHYRGMVAIRSMRDLDDKGYLSSPEKLIDELSEFRTYEGINGHVRQINGFGPWIAYKIADMVERLSISPEVFFSSHDVFLFDSPAKAAALLYKRENPKAPPPSPTEINRWAVRLLEAKFKGYKAPPLYDRPINVQEIETVLCKWKSHLSGHYPPGKDIREISHGLEQFAEESPTAKILFKLNRRLEKSLDSYLEQKTAFPA